MNHAHSVRAYLLNATCNITQSNMAVLHSFQQSDVVLWSFSVCTSIPTANRHRNSRSTTNIQRMLLTSFLLVSSADNLCKEFMSGLI